MPLFDKGFQGILRALVSSEIDERLKENGGK